MKALDQVQGQGAGRLKKRSPPQADEHFEEVDNPPEADY